MRSRRGTVVAGMASLGLAIAPGCGDDAPANFSETVALYAPAILDGPPVFQVETLTAFTGPAFDSSQDHVLEYQFDWGDDSETDWGSRAQQHAWTAVGEYDAKVRARCAEHTGIMSRWYTATERLLAMPAGTCSIYPLAIEFGGVVIGGPLASREVTFYNGTLSTMVVTPGAPCQPIFTIQPVGSWIVGPRSHYEGTIEFHPNTTNFVFCTFELGGCTSIEVTGIGRLQ